VFYLDITKVDLASISCNRTHLPQLPAAAVGVPPWVTVREPKAGRRICDVHPHVEAGDWDPCSDWEARWAAGTGRRVMRARSVLLHGDRNAPVLQSFYVAGLIG
jgi:hypothetical protein